VPRLKLTVAYDGTGLVGWQRQPTGTSIQQLLEEALAPLQDAPITVTGAGRTDAGVHALAQVASVTIDRDIDPLSVMRAANTRLPPAVRVVRADAAGPAFHARFDAVAKTYRYRIWNAEVLSPFERPYAWHVPWPRLDAEAMDAGAARLVGTHDFAAFQGSGSETETSVRTILSARVARVAGDGESPLVTFEVCGDGFLRHMVRNLAGTLVEVGRGRQPAVWIDELLAARVRADAGRTAPAAGLFLVGVQYR
jgi:tRNA pseudouridine38-40 synthase